MHDFICVCVCVEKNAHAKIVTAVTKYCRLMLRKTHTLPRRPMFRFQMCDITSGISARQLWVQGTVLY